MNDPERVPLAQARDLLVPGEPLPFPVIDAMGRLLLGAGRRIVDEKQLEALIEREACVDLLELEQFRRSREGQADDAEAEAPVPYGPVAAGRPRRTWFEAWEQQVWVLDGLLRRLGREPGLAAPIEAFADAQLQLIDRHPDGALFCAVRQDDGRFALYAQTHALHTTTVALLTARVLGWPAARVRTLVLAALTMNASITELQAQMAEQPDRPSAHQMDQIHAHPKASAALLAASGISDPAWLAAVLDHHERPGGGGYPRGLQSVDETVRVLRAADIFTAKISPRAMRGALAPQTAARQLFQEEAGGPVAGALIKAVGVYPPGDFVTLRNGETAIVAVRGQTGNTPVVMSVLGPSGKPLPGTPRRDTSMPEFAIAGTLAERKDLPRVLPEQVFGRVLL